MKLCPNKHTMPNGENFPDMFVACPICGTALMDEMQNVQPVCKKCGLQLDKAWNICPACGTPVENSVSKNENTIPEDVLEILEKMHAIQKFNLQSHDNKKLMQLGQLGDKLEELHDLNFYIELDKKCPNSELEYFLSVYDSDNRDYWNIKAAENGRIESYIDAYHFYLEDNTEKAFGYLKKGIDAGDYECILSKANYLLDSKDENFDDDLFELLDKLIDSQSDYYKRSAYGIKGNVFADLEDYEKAFDLYTSSFELGSPLAGFYLAEMYKEGLGVEPDTEYAISIYKKIIDERMGDDSINGKAAYELGRIYSIETEDEESSFACYKLAADLEYEMAYIFVALDYESGDGVEPDSKKSLYWMKKACDSEDDVISAFACHKLGEWYFNGTNCCEENPYKAFEFDYYKIAAEKGYSMAQNMVGVYYDNGEYAEQDSQKAVYWYKKALKSDENNLPAKFNLGSSYYYGTGVNVDENYGLQLIQEAADGGYESAQEWLNENT